MRALLSISSHLYLFAALLYVGYFLRSSRWLARAALGLLLAGFALHLASSAHRFLALGPGAFVELGEGLSLLGLLLVALFLVLQHRYRLPVIGVFVMPIVVGAMLPAVLLRPDTLPPIPESLALVGIPVHVVIAFAGIAAFGLAAGVGVAYLLLERQMKIKRFGVLFSRLPSLHTLDEISDRMTRWGFVALSLTLLSGAFFAKQAWGQYWRWDPKLTLSLVGWSIYAGLLQARVLAGWHGRRAAVLTLVGFAILLGSYLGLKLFPVGLHGGDYLASGLIGGLG